MGMSSKKKVGGEQSGAPAKRAARLCEAATTGQLGSYQYQ